MTISGFTFLRNAHKLYYPVKESILSILDLVDEFVVALGEGDKDDTSFQILNEINSPKIKIIYTKWDIETFENGSIYAQQTDIAKNACSGDWLFYLQADELIHEDDILEIKQACLKYLKNEKVEGFVFNYLHFFGDYQHYFSDHCWYKKEIRIVRNLPEIHSWRDAQSFRFIPNFISNDYFRKKNTRKLNCVLLNARVFHYGWVRPPATMALKSEQANEYYSKNNLSNDNNVFDYGRLDYCKKFTDSHPALMWNRIAALDWSNLLRFSGEVAINRPLMKHEKTKYRILNFIETHFMRGHVLGGFKNYKKVDVG